MDEIKGMKNNEIIKEQMGLSKEIPQVPKEERCQMDEGVTDPEFGVDSRYSSDEERIKDGKELMKGRLKRLNIKCSAKGCDVVAVGFFNDGQKDPACDYHMRKWDKQHDDGDF